MANETMTDKDKVIALALKDISDWVDRMGQIGYASAKEQAFKAVGYVGSPQPRTLVNAEEGYVDVALIDRNGLSPVRFRLIVAELPPIS